MTPKPFDPTCPPSPSSVAREDDNTPEKRDDEQERPDMTVSTTPLSLVVLGIFGQDGEWDEEKYEYISPPMTRYRLNTTYPGGDEYEVATFVPIEGLVAEDGPHEFSHNDLSDDEDEDEKEAGRAVLFQSIENYETISRNPTFVKYFHLADRDYYKGDDDQPPLTLTDQQLLIDRTLEDPRFGEQIIVQGATSNNICLGDIFEVQAGASPLRFQVTCPRKPCYALDQKNKTPMGARGIKKFTQSNGLAGWFTSVLVEGELKDGQTLVRTHNPYPKWTIANLAHALYGGEGDPKAALRGLPSWGRSKQELQELMSIDILCEDEWKEELEALMEQIIREEGVVSRLTERLASLFGQKRVVFLQWPPSMRDMQWISLAFVVCLCCIFAAMAWTENLTGVLVETGRSSYRGITYFVEASIGRILFCFSDKCPAQ